MSDLIRREDVIAVIKRCKDRLQGKGLTYEIMLDMVERIPSADNEVVGKLKTAIESEELCKNCPTAERISRENLLGAMALGFSYGINADRPQGFWTKVDVATYRCSECGKKQIADDINELNFCCCCGSQNKVRYKVQMLKGADDEESDR